MKTSDPSPEGISVVYPTRDRPELLQRSIRALLKNSLLPDEIIVVDQSRTDLTQRMLADLNDPRIVHIASRETGLSRGRNGGIRASRSPVIGFLDDDCIPARDWIASALTAIRRFPESGVWIGEVFRNEKDDPDSISADIPEDCLTLTSADDPWLVGPTGGNSFFRKSVFDTVGSFDPLLGQGSNFPGAEDGDMAYRILRKKIPVTYINTIRCVHVGWRDDEENIQNGYNYGSGVGAMMAKFLAQGDNYPLFNIFPRRFLSRFLSLPFNILLGRKKKFLVNLKWSQGMIDGFLKWRRMHADKKTGADK